MARRRNRFKQWFLAVISIVFLRFTQVIPLSWSRRIGVALAWTAFHVIPRMRLVGLANLDRAYGEAFSHREKLRILGQAAKNLGIVVAEFGRIPEFKTIGCANRVTLKGLNRVDRSRGALMIGAHLGNWEWLCPAFRTQGLRCGEVVRPLDSPRLNAVVDAVRRGGDIETIGKDNAAATVIRRIREGEYVGILIDQNPREHGVPVTFFGHQTWGTAAPAMIALRSKAPVHPVSIVRDVNGQYTLEILPPLDVVRTGSLQDDLARIAQQCQDAIEAMIRACPEQWLWFHRRWRERPRLEREWAARNATPAKKSSGAAT